MLTRRTLLKGLALGAGLAIAGPAGGLVAGADDSETAIRKAGSFPYPALPAGTNTIPQIEHIVVVMMENHTYDAYLGMFNQGDGFTVVGGTPTNHCPDAAGRPVYATHSPSTCQATSTVSQSWDASHQCWDYGAMDGFARTNGAAAMQYWTGDDIPFYWSLASNFTLCDRYFSSVMAQTYPNRRFLISGSAFGQVSDPLPGATDPNPRPGGFGTIFDVLNHFGISWKDYFTDVPTAGLFPYVVEQNPGKVAPIAEFFTDAAAGTLPGFSIVDPDYQQSSEENPQDLAVGQHWVSQVVNAVLKSPAWPKTVLIWTYDEGGGYYDHVRPPRAVRPDNIPPAVPAGDTYGDLYSYYGFRVPTVVVSPWSRPGRVCSTVFDHTSILKLVETKWNLPALSDRDANANNMLDCLDLSGQPALLHPPALAPAQPPTGAAACVGQNPQGALP